jgi:hypothetical protein
MLSAFFLILIVAVPSADAENTFRRTAIYGGHVTLDVPMNWEEIPPDLLESHSLRMAEATGGRVTEVYQYGFRGRDPAINFIFPECLIQIRESGRLNYRRFLELPSIEEMRLASEDTLAERRGVAATGLELSDAFFDSENFSLHLSNILDLRFERKTIVTSVAFLTERGLLIIHFYAPAEQVEAMAPIYQHIVDSVRLDTEIQYRPRLMDRVPPKLPLILLALAAIIALGAATLSVYQRKRRQQ